MSANETVKVDILLLDTMSDKKEVDGCLKWISNQQTLQEKSEFGYNKKAVDESLTEQQHRCALIRDYGTEVDKIKDGSKDPLLTVDLQKAYDALLVISGRRLDGLQTMAQITLMEDLFSTLSDTFSKNATDLVAAFPSDASSQADNAAFQLNGSAANTSQSCILANRKNWSWMTKLADCSKIHLQNSAEYHQFYYDLREYHRWMPVELYKVEDLLNWANMKRNQQGADASRLIFEIKTALAIVHNWLSKVDAIWERSRHVVPVPLRTKGLDHERPVRVLCDYKTKEINIQEGEELNLLDNSKTHTWKVRNLRGEEFVVPSVILLIPGPDLAAIDAALKLRLQFLAAWTNMVKRFGKTIILFLLQVIRVWTPVEESLLRSLSDSDKKEILHLLESIETTFSPYWDLYPPFQLLKSRMQKLREILAQKPTEEDKLTAENGNLLVIQTKILEDLLQKFRGFWGDWEKYKVSTESLRHPEYLLSVKNWEDYNFLDISEWLKKWSTALEFDELDYADMGQEVAEEVHTLERAKETAETSHLTTSEQEERQTFIITGVIDPRNDKEISLDQAVSEGIINQTEGRFVNPDTGESIPIPVAMNAGKIKVEMTRTKKSAEKRRDVGLITIRTVIESRPYTIKGVVDAKTERQMTIDEATKAGILDQKKGVYINQNTREELSLGDALDSGLLVVDFESDTTDSKNREPETATKTYSVHAVIDMKNKARVGFAEAVQKGLINADTGAYYNNATREHVYIGDAIKKGYVKATVILDKNTVDIDPGNCITLAESAMENFRHKLIQPLKAVQALKKAGAVQNGR